jgi:hypothetical protein
VESSSSICTMERDYLPWGCGFHPYICCTALLIQSADVLDIILSVTSRSHVCEVLKSGLQYEERMSGGRLIKYPSKEFISNKAELACLRQISGSFQDHTLLQILHVLCESHYGTTLHHRILSIDNRSPIAWETT